LLLFRQILRESKKLEQVVLELNHPKLTMVGELNKFTLPRPDVVEHPTGVSETDFPYAKIIRKQFEAHRDYTQTEDILELQSIGFRAIRKLKSRTRHIKNSWKEKPSDVQLDVGQVVRHKQKGYTGVIFGWDQECKSTVLLQTTMGVGDLHKGASQPFYYLLVNGPKQVEPSNSLTRKTTYVAQELLEPVEVPVVHDLIAKVHA